MQTKTGLLAFALVAACAASAQAQQAEGDWQGTLGTAGRVALQIDRTPTGEYQATIEAVDQSPERREVADVVFVGDRLSFRVPFIDGHFDGAWDPAVQGWAGQWKQRGGQGRLVLTPGTPAPFPRIEGMDGSWHGTIDAGAATLRLVLHIRTGPRGTLAKLDSPDQLATGLPVSELARDREQVRFALASVGAAFAGKLSADAQVLEGVWSQQGAAMPVRLERQAPGSGAGPRRPQMPRLPYPYREIEAIFPNPSAAEVRLAGTLTVPEGAGPFPVAVLISGSGGQDRDSTVFGHKPFLVMADHLTRSGIAVLRVDDRGVGKSSGSREEATTADFATDVAAGVTWLRALPEIDPARIGLIGMSEGGVIAPMVAAADPKIAFSVLLAGPAGRGDALWLEQYRTLGMSMGATPDELDRHEPLMRRVVEAVRNAPDTEAAKQRARAVLATASPEEALPAHAAEPLLAQLTTPWMRFFLRYDALATLRKVRSPILALNGSKDVQVDAQRNLAAMREATAENPDVTVREVPGVNHLFQTAPTGAMGEYADIEETIAPAVLEQIMQWVTQRVVSEQR